MGRKRRSGAQQRKLRRTKRVLAAAMPTELWDVVLTVALAPQWRFNAVLVCRAWYVMIRRACPIGIDPFEYDSVSHERETIKSARGLLVRASTVLVSWPRLRPDMWLAPVTFSGRQRKHYGACPVLHDAHLVGHAQCESGPHDLWMWCLYHATPVRGSFALKRRDCVVSMIGAWLASKTDALVDYVFDHVIGRFIVCYCESETRSASLRSHDYDYYTMRIRLADALVRNGLVERFERQFPTHALHKWCSRDNLIKADALEMLKEVQVKRYCDKIYKDAELWEHAARANAVRVIGWFIELALADRVESDPSTHWPPAALTSFTGRRDREGPCLDVAVRTAIAHGNVSVLLLLYRRGAIPLRDTPSQLVKAACRSHNIMGLTWCLAMCQDVQVDASSFAQKAVQHERFHWRSGSVVKWDAWKAVRFVMRLRGHFGGETHVPPLDTLDALVDVLHKSSSTRCTSGILVGYTPLFASAIAVLRSKDHHCPPDARECCRSCVLARECRKSHLFCNLHKHASMRNGTLLHDRVIDDATAVTYAWALLVDWALSRRVRAFACAADYEVAERVTLALDRIARGLDPESAHVLVREVNLWGSLDALFNQHCYDSDRPFSLAGSIAYALARLDAHDPDKAIEYAGRAQLSVWSWNNHGTTLLGQQTATPAMWRRWWRPSGVVLSPSRFRDEGAYPLAVQHARKGQTPNRAQSEQVSENERIIIDTVRVLVGHDLLVLPPDGATAPDQ